MLTASFSAATAAGPGAAVDLTQLSIEDLMQVQITSATKQAQPWANTAAAVFVITADDIRRSGVTHVMGALRLAPGVEVARIDSSRWAITIRGFNGRFANKLLVMIDGRSVYTPSFSGVYWEIQDMSLDNIERIEVIRGPGGSLWGANAVNGVINIMTKPASETQGGMVSVTAGHEERAIVEARYGGKLGDTAHYRLYGRYAERDGSVAPGGQDAGDDWNLQRGGFRLDWQPTARDSVTVLGDVYDGDLRQNMVIPTLTPPDNQRQLDQAKANGSSVQARWEHQNSSTGQLALQLYYQQEERSDLMQSSELETLDLDFQHNLKLGERQEIVWGLNYRRYQDQFGPATLVSIMPEARTTELFSLFAQDQVALTERLRLTLGAKIEHNDYTGWEWQPNLRLLWQPSDTQRVWGAVSRAVRTPSRAEEEGQTNLTTIPPLPEMGWMPSVLALIGNGTFDAEKLTAYEIGYRTWLGQDFSLDFTTFYNDYKNLQSVEPGTPWPEGTPLPPHGVFPLYFHNAFTDDNYGAELAVDWRPLEKWRVQFAYSYLWSRPEQKNWSPLNQVSLLSSWEIRDDLEFDAWIYYVGKIGSLPTLSPLGTVTIDPRLNLTLRLGWRPRRDLELSLVGANLLDDRQLEYVQEAYTFPVEIERSIYGQFKWSF